MDMRSVWQVRVNPKHKGDTSDVLNESSIRAVINFLKMQPQLQAILPLFCSIAIFALTLTGIRKIRRY
jgi:hypothetical protein